MTEPPSSQRQFSEHVAALLAGRDAVVVEARALTDFSWTTLCFKREAGLSLTFGRAGGAAVLSLPYEEFFVDEGHVESSLEDSCLTPSDRILIKNKYPGASGPIEFQKAPRV